MSKFWELLSKYKGEKESLRDFALRLDAIDHTNLVGWRKGKTPSLGTVIRIGRALNLSEIETAWLEEAATGEGSVNRPKGVLFWERLMWYKGPSETLEGFAIRAGFSIKTLKRWERQGGFDKHSDLEQIKCRLYLTNEQVGWIATGDFETMENGGK